MEGIAILYGNVLTIQEVGKAERSINLFVSQVERLYSKDAMTYNVLCLTHLARSVANWGPLWAHSAYCFESGNGNIVKMIKAS